MFEAKTTVEYNLSLGELLKFTDVHGSATILYERIVQALHTERENTRKRIYQLLADKMEAMHKHLHYSGFSDVIVDELIQWCLDQMQEQECPGKS